MMKLITSKPVVEKETEKAICVFRTWIPKSCSKITDEGLFIKESMWYENILSHSSRELNMQIGSRKIRKY